MDNSVGDGSAMSDDHEKRIDRELERRIAACRADYETHYGRPCRHFVCPILGRDEDVEMCRGHMVSLGSNDIWVPQRKDVDNFYGSVVEADLATVMKDRGKDPWELLFNPSSRKRHRFQMTHKGEAVKFYFPQPSHQPVPNHTRIEIRDSSDEIFCNLAITKSPDDLAPDTRLDLIVERDFRPPVVAPILKAAHLTLFRMNGYNHVISSGGVLLGDILKVFFEQHEGSHAVPEEAVERYFSRYTSMIAPLVVKKADFLNGTAEDNMLLLCEGATQGPYAMGAVVKVKADRFCVFVPTDLGATIDTYVSFLNEPPPFVTARIMRFCDGSDGKGTRWEVAPKTRQIFLNQDMPPDHFQS